MTPYVGEAVDALVQEPAGSESVELLLGIREGYMPDVKSDLEGLGATETEQLPFNSLRAETPQAAVAEVCNLDGIESVEVDDGMEILAGN